MTGLRAFRVLAVLGGLIAGQVSVCFAQTDTPKATLKEAFQIGWLHDESAWLQMLQDRNLTSHVYDETIANRIFQDIKKYFPEMQQVFKELKQRFISS